MTAVAAFLRRHLLLILFSILIILQAATLLELRDSRRAIADNYPCGSTTNPCRVMIIQRPY